MSRPPKKSGKKESAHTYKRICFLFLNTLDSSFLAVLTPKFGKIKPSKFGKQRKKINVVGTFQEYTKQKEQAEANGNMAPPPGAPGQNKDDILVLQRDAKGMVIMGPKSNVKDPKGP